MSFWQNAVVHKYVTVLNAARSMPRVVLCLYLSGCCLQGCLLCFPFFLASFSFDTFLDVIFPVIDFPSVTSTLTAFLPFIVPFVKCLSFLSCPIFTHSPVASLYVVFSVVLSPISSFCNHLPLLSSKYWCMNSWSKARLSYYQPLSFIQFAKLLKLLARCQTLP